MSTLKDKVSLQIETQMPDFVQAENPNFISFMKAYYEFMESAELKLTTLGSIDAIILESENLEYNKVLGKNPFSLMINLFGHLSDQVEKGDIAIGRLAAKHRNVKLNLYFTPTKLTENSLIFNKQLMETWWQQGYHYAESKHAIGQPMGKSEKFKDETENV